MKFFEDLEKMRISKSRRQKLTQVLTSLAAMKDIIVEQAAMIENLGAQLEGSEKSKVAFCARRLKQSCGLKDASKCCVHANVERKRAARRSWTSGPTGVN